MKRLRNFSQRFAYGIMLATMLLFGGSGKVFATVGECVAAGGSVQDCNALYGNWPGWVPRSGSACSTTTDTTTTNPVSNDTTAQQIAQTFIIGFDANTPKAVITDLATKYHIGGMYLVHASEGPIATKSSNAQQKGFDKAFYDSLNAAAGAPLVIASDEEGAVTRYYYPAGFPTAGEMSKKSDSQVQAIGKSAGDNMASYGVTTDLAPVLDRRDVGNGLTGRSFSPNPAIIADKAGAFAAGLKASGVTPIFKHFPGFDSTTSGSTDDQKVVMTGDISKVIAPYKALLKQYPDAGVMLSNLYVNKLDAANPSSMSAATVKYLQATLGFKGMITTDDLSVGSVTSKAGSLGDAVSNSLQAGVSMPLFTLGGSTVAEAENNLNSVIGVVQKNSAAMSVVNDATHIQVIQKFKGSTNSTTQPAPVSAGCCGGAATLAGDDNETKVFNYFVGKGLPAAGAAGIMGNMNAESHFNPTAEQSPGAWEDSSNLYFPDSKGGVGLVQWDGGRRPNAVKFLASKGFSDADLHHASDALLAGELDRVWQELTGSYADTLQLLQKETDPAQAAYDFHKGYEGSNDSPEAIKKNRQDPAVEFYNKFSGAATGTTSTGGTSCGSNLPPDCTSATGVAKILCAAKAYDAVSYSASETGGHQGGAKFHQDCPTIGDTAGCELDCSGLVNIAVYDAFGVDLRESTGSEYSDTKNWKRITFAQLQAGDLVQPNSGHVEIVDHIVGNKIYAFGAHTQNIQPQSREVGEWDDMPDSGTSSYAFLHYIGPGVQ